MQREKTDYTIRSNYCTNDHILEQCDTFNDVGEVLDSKLTFII